jgi:hypothetical protein
MLPDSLEKDAIDERADDLVEAPQVRADDRARDDDHDDALEGLAAARPVDLPKLGGGLANELAAAVLRAAPRLLLDGLLAGTDLGLAPAAPCGGTVARRGPGGSSLSARLACQLGYLVSRCGVWRPHQRQYFRNSTRSGELRLDFWVW